MRVVEARRGPLSRVPVAVGQIIVSGLLWLLFPIASLAAESRSFPSGKQVVVLYPVAPDGSPGVVQANRGIRTAFGEARGQPVVVRNEYLDFARFSDAAYQQDLANFLKRKYSTEKVDLVMVGLGPILDYCLRFREEIFPAVPVVFFAVDRAEIESRKLAADMIGVPIEFDLDGSLGFALRLHPETRHVYVVAGRSEYDAYWQAAARQEFLPQTAGLDVTYLAGQSLEDLLRQVSQLPERSVIYYLHVFEDGDGRTLNPAEVVAQLSASANAPIYGHSDSYLGQGVVGGRVFSFEAEGRRAAQLGLRILSGEPPANIGIQSSAENRYVVDWRQLKRWGISESRLPANTVIRFRTPSIWESYRWPMIGLMTVFLVQTLLIVALVVQRTLRRQAERRFRQAIDAAPTGMLMVAQDGTVLLANAPAEAIFGYRNDELLGRPVEVLLPERLRTSHGSLRQAFFASPQTRPMGVGREILGRHKDGREIPLEIGLSPIRTEIGCVVLASVVDTTERRRTQSVLRENAEELRQLAGQLMEAQETERRRISRELHDDCGQNLALLSVEIDLLRQLPSHGPVELTSRLDELSQRVKQLSSSIHDLSHQIHPLKLEQLGLVAAVRGLCNDLSQIHGLNIDFAYHHVPDAIPRDVALCLYRIVQEALRNVIKHSRAEHACVELSGKEHALWLQILDTGIGFDPGSSALKPGLGLVSMRERLRLVNGQITIHAQPGDGTQIDVCAPLGGSAAGKLES